MIEKLIDELKGKKRVFLNAEKWNIVFEAYQSKGPFSKDAEIIIWQFANSLIRKQICRLTFNSALEEEYKDRAYDRLSRYILQNDGDVNVTYFRMNVVDGAYLDVIRRYSDQIHVAGKWVQPGAIDPLDNIPDSDYPSIDKIVCLEQEKAIIKEVDKLPPKQKKAIYGVHRDEKTDKQMAKERGGNPGAIRQAISTARKRLKKRLHEIDKTKPDIKTMLEGVRQWPA